MSKHNNYRAILENLCEKIEENNIRFNDNSVTEENIFSILNIVNKEVMYCRVLKYLIETNWDTFKSNVLCKKINEEEFEGSGLKRIELEYECGTPCDKYSKKGRIDILLETDKEQIIVIEAKVYADDQEHQLFRYKKEIANTFENYKYYILYLTLDGHAPDSNSLKCGKYDKNAEMCKKCSHINNDECICISFQEDISNWLESMISDFENNSIVKQFLEVINMSKNNYEQEIKLLGENIGFAKTVLALGEAFPSFWEKIRNDFFDKLANKLVAEGFEIKSNSDEPYKRETWAYTLEKNGAPLYFCYETNFFLRTGTEDGNWVYIDKKVFEDKYTKDYDFGTLKACDAFNVKYYSNSSEGLLKWAYYGDKQEGIIEKIAETAKKFFDKKHI